MKQYKEYIKDKELKENKSNKTYSSLFLKTAKEMIEKHKVALEKLKNDEQ